VGPRDRQDGLRSWVGTDTTDPLFIQLVGELAVASETFRHPQVGDLLLGWVAVTPGE
jgi:hypothetical protein